MDDPTPHFCMTHPVRPVRTPCRPAVLAAVALSLSLLAPVSWASEPTEKARRPTPRPALSAQAIPELVCTGARAVTITHASLAAREEATPLHLRLRGNLLYLGPDAPSEKFFGLINRSDRRRWTSGTATLRLDESLQSGVWSRSSLDSTQVSAVRCNPFDRKSP
jgi:hypothetical protein